MDSTNKGAIRVLMFPWLAYSHIHPFMELAKKLSKRNFYIYLCSSPVNLDQIRVKEGNFPSIELVQLDLPSSPELPTQYHTTRDLPRHLVSELIKTFDKARCSFSNILTAIKPDVLISDLLQSWAPALALSLDIPSVTFHASGSWRGDFLSNYAQNESGVAPPLRSNYYNYPLDYADDNLNRRDRAFLSMEASSNVILIRSSREIEGNSINEFSIRATKKIVPVGVLVPDACEENEKTEISEWLNKKEQSTVVFVSLGSECYFSREDIKELAHGLLVSNVSFIWVLRFPESEKISVEEATPEGFTEMVRGRGLIVVKWAPQKRILSHPSIGGFLTHCGMGSTLESMKFGVPIIAMPENFEQSLNAKLAAEIGIGLEIKRERNGNFGREKIAKLIREVMVEETGKHMRRKAKELSDRIRNKGDEEIDEVANELGQLCGKGTDKQP